MECSPFAVRGTAAAGTAADTRYHCKRKSERARERVRKRVSSFLGGSNNVLVSYSILAVAEVAVVVFPWPLLCFVRRRRRCRRRRHRLPRPYPRSSCISWPKVYLPVGPAAGRPSHRKNKVLPTLSPIDQFRGDKSHETCQSVAILVR